MELPAQPELIPAWRDVRAGLRRAVGEATYQIWLEPLEAQDWDGSVLVLRAPRDTQTWVQKRFGRILEGCVRTVFGPAARVSVTADTAAITPTTRREESADIPIPGAPTAHFNPRYSFDQFVMGDANRLAHGAALAVAENPGHAYNPLFLYGHPGLGKTHLLHAIGNYLTAFTPATTVRYTTVEAFTNSFIAALSTKSIEHFKHRYRNVDVLLIDDVQFLASKAKTEEEFFHTFNAIYDAGHQLVLTCDRVPNRLLSVEERLRDRFQSGLVAELDAPDHATRVAILRKRVALDNIHLEDPLVLDLVADRITDNIRSLEGALIRLVAIQSLTGRPLDVPLARSVLDDIHPGAQPSAPSLEQIQDVVAAHFQLRPADLVSANRAAKVAWPRHLAIQLARDLTSHSLNAIGEAFGGRNHATVLHACRRVSERVGRDPEAAATVSALRSELADSA